MNASWLKFLPSFLHDRLDGRHHLQQAMGNTGWLMLDKAVRYGLGIIVGVLIARHLGPNDYGALSYASAFVAMFAVLSTIGIDDVVVQKLVKNMGDKEEILGTAFWLKFASSFFVALLVYLSIFVFRANQPDMQLIVLILALTLVFQPFEVVDYFFQAKTQSKPVVIARIGAFLFSSALRIGMVIAGGEVIHFAIAALFEAFITGCLLIATYHYSDRDIPSWQFSRPLAIYLLQAGWPILISGTCVAITMQADKVLLGEIRNNYEVGLYTAANQLSSVWNIFPVIIGASLVPAITRMYTRNHFLYQARLQQVYVFLTYFALAAVIAVTFLADDLIRLLFGGKFAGASNILTIHIWGSLFVFHVSMRTRALLIEGKQRYIAAFAMLTLGANLILNIMLIVPFGAIGAAYASAVSWFLCAGIFPLIWGDTRGSAFMFYKSFIPSRLL